MKILLAPSETKTEGGEDCLNLDNLLFKELKDTRLKLINSYQDIIISSTTQELKNFLGIKKESEIEKYIVNLLKEPTKKAIQRYSGVAFDYLNYNSLNDIEQKYIDENVILFSNLFGVLRANDKIPNYKLKQGTTLNGIKTDKVYNSLLKDLLDEYLKDEDILDIRAGYYDKFYKPNRKYTTLKFLKNGKVVSHWAKAYRGLIVNICAKNGISSINELIRLEIPQLQILEIIETKRKQEIIYEVE